MVAWKSRIDGQIVNRNDNHSHKLQYIRLIWTHQTITICIEINCNNDDHTARHNELDSVQCTMYILTLSSWGLWNENIFIENF